MKTDHPVAELPESRRRRGAGEPGADHDDGEFPSVGGVDQLDPEAVVVPLVLQRSGRDLGVELDVHGHAGSMNPKTTAEHDAHVAQDDHRGERLGEPASPLIEAGVVEPEALEHAPGAVIDVEAEGDVGGDIEHCHRPPGEAGHHVVVHRAPYEIGVGPPPGEVGEVVGEEEEDDHPGPAHGS